MLQIMKACGAIRLYILQLNSDDFRDAPNATDVVNAKAFTEAHKDLVQMLNKANASALPKP